MLTLRLMPVRVGPHVVLHKGCSCTVSTANPVVKWKSLDSRLEAHLSFTQSDVAKTFKKRRFLKL